MHKLHFSFRKPDRTVSIYLQKTISFLRKPNRQVSIYFLKTKQNKFHFIFRKPHKTVPLYFSKTKQTSFDLFLENQIEQFHFIKKTNRTVPFYLTISLFSQGRNIFLGYRRTSSSLPSSSLPFCLPATFLPSSLPLLLPTSLPETPKHVNMVFLKCTEIHACFVFLLYFCVVHFDKQLQ